MSPIAIVRLIAIGLGAVKQAEGLADGKASGEEKKAAAVAIVQGGISAAGVCGLPIGEDLSRELCAIAGQLVEETLAIAKLTGAIKRDQPSPAG